MRRLVFQSYANNEVRVGWDELPYPKRTGADLSAQREAERRGRVHDEKRQQWLSDNNITEFRDANGTLYRSRQEKGEYICSGVRENLVITSELQETIASKRSHTKGDYSKPVGATNFTRNARHRLLEAGQVCEERRVKGAIGCFVTFTLPGSSHAAYVELGKYSGYVASSITQCLRDHKRTQSYFWVWERQKRGALHLHLFIELRPNTPWDYYRDPLRIAWYSALSRVAESTGVDMFRHGDGAYCTASRHWRYDYQEVRKGVANYISKYVSKEAVSGFSEVPTTGDARVFPRRWWYMSRDLTQEINSRRKTICVEGITDEEAIGVIECMDAMIADMEPVLNHEYIADIGRTPQRKHGFGRTYRKLSWFDACNYEEIEVVLRTAFIRAIQSIRKTRVTYRGFALDYGGYLLYNGDNPV